MTAGSELKAAAVTISDLVDYLSAVLATADNAPDHWESVTRALNAIDGLECQSHDDLTSLLALLSRSLADLARNTTPEKPCSVSSLEYLQRLSWKGLTFIARQVSSCRSTLH